MSYSARGAQCCYCVASICMQILHFWSNAVTITYFKGQRIPSPFLIASQLRNYPKETRFNLFPSNSSVAHLNVFFFQCFFLLCYDKDQVTLTTKLQFLTFSNQELHNKKLFLCVCVCVCVNTRDFASQYSTVRIWRPKKLWFCRWVWLLVVQCSLLLRPVTSTANPNTPY